MTDKPITMERTIPSQQKVDYIGINDIIITRAIVSLSKSLEKHLDDVPSHILQRNR